MEYYIRGFIILIIFYYSAAHCVSKVPVEWKLIAVRLGEWDTKTLKDCDDSYVTGSICNDPPVDVPVEEKIVHEEYVVNSKNQHHDIALLRLSRNVEYSEFIKPICLPIDNSLRNADLSGVSLDVSGWGKTEVSPSSTKKLKVALDAYKNSECQNIYSPSSIQIIDKQVRKLSHSRNIKDACERALDGP